MTKHFTKALKSFWRKLQRWPARVLCRCGWHRLEEVWSGWPPFKLYYMTGEVCTRPGCLTTRVTTDSLFDAGKPESLAFDQGFVWFQPKNKRTRQKIFEIWKISPTFWSEFFVNNQNRV